MISQVSVTTPAGVLLVFTTCTVCGPVNPVEFCRRRSEDSMRVAPWGSACTDPRKRRKKVKREAVGRAAGNMSEVV